MFGILSAEVRAVAAATAAMPAKQAALIITIGSDN